MFVVSPNGILMSSPHVQMVFDVPHGTPFATLGDSKYCPLLECSSAYLPNGTNLHGE